MNYRILETRICGISSFRVQYKKLKWYWFGWRDCYYDVDDYPKVYDIYSIALDIIKLHKQDFIDEVIYEI